MEKFMKKSVTSKIMLMTLGGSPEPLKKSIETNRPERVIFLASHDSVSLAGEILKGLEKKPSIKYEITEDPNLLYKCYKAARRCVERANKYGIPPNKVTVDYTGGTKVMTAALILATVGLEYRFSYVGGDSRNKNGVGTVIDGHEKMFEEMSPWSIFAEEERRQVVTLFNNRRFSAVNEIVNTAYKHDLPLQIRDYFRFVQPIAEGLLKWDQFEHKTALRFLDKGISFLEDYIHAYPDKALETFCGRLKDCKKYLETVVVSTDGLKKKHPVLIDDLLNNAQRKIADKRYDDAAARVYRTLELYGQILFEEVAGCSNDKVKPEIIPEGIKKKFIRKFRDPRSSYLKLPMTATFEYLQAKGHSAGVRFFERKKEIKNIQSNRNASILAHGIKNVSEKAINSIFDTVSDFVQAKNFFDFPKLP
jgi:CRISPR-associated protein (TIGR02710 family)